MVSYEIVIRASASGCETNRCAPDFVDPDAWHQLVHRVSRDRGSTISIEMALETSHRSYLGGSTVGGRPTDKAKTPSTIAIQSSPAELAFSRR